MILKTLKSIGIEDNYLKEKGVNAAMTIDEGGFIGENLIKI